MKLLWILVAVVLLIVACDRDEDETVTVFAAASLRECVSEITAEWSKRSGVQAKIEFAGTSTLGKQIEYGAKADILLAASPEWLDHVAPTTHMNWLSNRLVLVTRKDTENVTLENLSSLALANEHVPAGAYAKAALEHLGISYPKRVVYGSSVRDTLSIVSQGGAVAGIVYATDASVAPDLRIAYAFPEDSHPKIIYAAGLLSERGNELFDALTKNWALDIARHHGFEVIDP